MSKRPPAKRRGPTRPPRAERTDEADPRGYSAPGHLGGQFEDSGYSESHWDGWFGFQPTERMKWIAPRDGGYHARNDGRRRNPTRLPPGRGSASSSSATSTPGPEDEAE